MKTIRRNPDVSRMARAAQRPGIDPREWVKWGAVEVLGFDPDHGVFADVRMMPNGETETCCVGGPYSGDGFGDWCPLQVGDVVAVAYPEGTAEATPIIVARAWQAARKPPAQAQDASDGTEPTQDRVIVVKPGQKLRVYVTSGGEVQMFAGASTFVKVQDGTVIAGDATAAKLAMGAALNEVITALNAMAASMSAFTPPSTPATFAAFNSLGNALTLALSSIVKVQTTILEGT